MNEYIKELASQNPYMDLKCEHCNRTSKIKTIDYFKSNDSYSFTCPHCSKITEYTDIKETADKIKNEFKKLGIFVK